MRARRKANSLADGVATRFGGTNGLEWFNDVWSYDPRTNQWTQLDCIGFIPSPREGHAASLVGDVMYIFGGRSSEGTDLGDLAAFRISSRRWYTFQNMGPSPSPRSGHTMSTVGAKIVVLGGEPSVPARSQEELQLVYVLDTAKIRYPTDNPAQPSPTDRNRVAGPQPQQRGPGPAALGPRNGSIDGPLNGPGRLPQGSKGPQGLQGPQGPQKPVPQESVMGSTPPSGGIGPQQGNIQGNNNSNAPTGPGGSRLPRASLGNQPSGPPPSQQAPAPRSNGAPAGGPGPGSRTPTGPAVKGKENTPPVQENAAAAATANGKRAPTNQKRDTREGPRSGSRQHQHQQQQSIDSLNGPISEEPEPQSPQPQQQQAPQRPSIDVRAPSDQPTIPDSLSPVGSQQPLPSFSGLVADKNPGPGHEEFEKLKSTNDWYASELALARRAGYTPQTNHSALLENRGRDVVADDDRPFVEAMLALKGELGKVQSQLDVQSAEAAKRMQDIERQRDVAFQEAVYAKAKLAALGGPASPVPGDKSSDVASMDQEKMTDMSRKLAASLSAQADLSAKVQVLTQEVASEKKARYLADEMASTAQRRIAELDEYRNRAGSEIENLRAELLDAGKAYRDEAALGQEAAADVKLLRVDQAELTDRLKEVLAENRSYQGSLEQLSKAMQINNAKSGTLERQLEEERQTKEALERKLAQLRSENEEKSADLQSVNQRLKDVEEMMETYAEEAKAANAVMAAGLDKVTAREPPNMLTSAAEERVMILQEQVANTQSLLAKSKAQADETGEKLAEAMQRVAGLEFQQGQSSKDSIALRRRMAEVSDDARRLKQENAELVNQLGQKQLEVDAVTAKHNALKKILQERGSQPNLDKRRSRNLQNPSPESGTATPEQLNRLRELEARLEDSLRAHRETKNTAEMQAQEVEKHFREKLEQLENDYQAAVHYVKGTEKMLKRMKEELTKYKTQNAKLQQELDGARRGGAGGPPKLERLDSAEADSDWEQERELLNKEIEDLRTKVRESATALDRQIRETKSQLDNLREERDQLQSQHSEMQAQVTELSHQQNVAQSILERLESENSLLESRAQSAEQKVSMLLDQVENSVDAYRRSMRFEGPNGAIPESTRSSYYSGPDNRTSVALDSLASELDALRSQWETNKTYRLSSTTFDFEKSPNTPMQSDFPSNITQWRHKLAQDDEDSRSAGNSRQGMYAQEGREKSSPTQTTVAAGGGAI